MRKVLLVEDNPSMLEMLRETIGAKGYDVKTTRDVATALLILKKETFSAVVSDLQLPDMDGLSFYKRIKPLNIPFIILTAFGSIEKAVEAIKEGAFDFIAKPVDPDYLLLMIDKALESPTQLCARTWCSRKCCTAEMEKSVIIGSSRESCRTPKSCSRWPPPAPRCCCAAKAAPARSCSPAPFTP